MVREYKTANGIKPVNTGPGRIDDVRARGKRLNGELAKDGKTTSASSSLVAVEKPVYTTPAMNMRAAETAIAELSNLTGEALRKQQARVQELVVAANKLNAEMAKGKAGAGASQLIHSARGRSAGQASSPHRRFRRDLSVTSASRDLRIQAYDPTTRAGGSRSNQEDSRSAGACGRDPDRSRSGRERRQADPAGIGGQPPRSLAPLPPGTRKALLARTGVRRIAARLDLSNLTR